MALRRFMRRMAAVHRDERGQTGIATLLLFFVVFILAALALDGGLWYFDHRWAQNQVDAGATAAVLDLPATQAEITAPGGAAARAQEWLGYNGVSTVLDPPAFVTGKPPSNCGGSVAPGTAKIVFGDSSGSPEKYYSVRVCVRRDSAVLLSGLANVTGSIVSAGGTAKVRIQPLTYALMAMNPDNCTGGGDGLRSLNLAGSPGVVVNLLNEGGSYTRSPCDGAMYIDGGNITFNAGGTHDVVGQCAPDVRCAPPPGGQVTPDPTENYSVLLTDPFAAYAQPSIGDCRTDFASFTFTSSTTPLPPGTYCQPLVVQSTARVELQPGTHVFRAGLMVSGNAPQLVSTGPVLLFMTCAPRFANDFAYCSASPARVPPPAPGCSTVPGESQAATFCLQGNDGAAPLPQVNIEGPTAEPKAVIWVDRTAAAWNTTMIRIAGQGAIEIDGNLYAISSTIGLEGQGTGQNINLTGTVVADKIKFAGQATYNVTWDEDLAPKILDYALVE